MIIEFSLQTKAFSINKMHYRDQRFKTAEYKDWATKVLHLLSEIKELYDMGGDWQRSGGVFAVEFEFVYPAYIYYNKSKQVSSKTFDLSNVEKPLLDLIFGDTMEVNDRNVVKLVSSKRAGAMYAINVSIEHLQSD